MLLADFGRLLKTRYNPRFGRCYIFSSIKIVHKFSEHCNNTIITLIYYNVLNVNYEKMWRNMMHE